jgi:hypothetical protein
MIFEPINKWVVLKPIDETDKIGTLYLPHNVSTQYGRGTIQALPPNLPPEIDLLVGTVVFYDKLGEVRVGRGESETILVSYLNVLGTVRD